MDNIKEQLPWNSTSGDIVDYVSRNFGSYIDESVVDIGYNYIIKNQFGNDFDNRAHTAANIVQAIQDNYGISAHSTDHSNQVVPLLSIGKNSEQFNRCKSIADVPNIICDILGWENTLLFD